MDPEYMLLTNGSCPDRGDGLTRVYKRFACEGKADYHVSAHKEGPTMPHFNPFGLSDQKMWVKMISPKKFGDCVTRGT